MLQLKTAWRDGTTHLVMSPLDFIQRLAALVSNPKLRAQVVPQEHETPAQAAPPAEGEATCAHHRPVRLSWPKRLKRVFEIDMAHCPNCGGRLKIIAAILEQPVSEKILTHLGLQADCGRMTTPACGHAPQQGLAPASASAARRDESRRARPPVGRSCKQPETFQPTRFGQPGTQGCEDRLRQSFSQLRFGVRLLWKTLRRSPRMKLACVATCPE